MDDQKTSELRKVSDLHFFTEAAAIELNVISAAILERQTFLEGKFLDLQGAQGGIFKLAEAPLVRIRDKWNLLGFDY